MRICYITFIFDFFLFNVILKTLKTCNFFPNCQLTHPPPPSHLTVKILDPHWVSVMFCSVFIVKYGSLWKRFWDHLIFEILDVVYDDVHVWVYVHISLSYRLRLQFIKVHCIYYPYLPKCTWRSNHPLRWQRRWLLLPVHGKPLVCEVGKGLLLATQETWKHTPPVRWVGGWGVGEGPKDGYYKFLCLTVQ